MTEHDKRPSDEEWLTEEGFDADSAQLLLVSLGSLTTLGGPTLLVQPSDKGSWYLMRPVWPDGDPSLPELVRREDGMIPVIEGSDQTVAGFVAGVFWALSN